MLSEREIACLLINNDTVCAADVIVLLEGDGLFRIDKAVELYKSGLASRIVFSGGIHNEAYGSFPFEFFLPELLKKGVEAEHIEVEGKSQHTQEQAVEFVKLAKERNWKSFILVASHFHQYRAYMTFLAEILKTYPELIMMNAPAHNLSWFEENKWGKRIDLLESEFAKVDLYAEKKHIAGFNDVIQYQKWKEKELQLRKLN